MNEAETRAELIAPAFFVLVPTLQRGNAYGGRISLRYGFPRRTVGTSKERQGEVSKWVEADTR